MHVGAPPRSRQARQLGTSSGQWEGRRVKLLDCSLVYSRLNTNGEVMWPNPEWQEKGGESFWGHFRPSYGAQGVVQYVWEPNASNPVKQSNSYETICLVLLSDEHIVPVNSRGLMVLMESQPASPRSLPAVQRRGESQPAVAGRLVRLVNTQQVLPEVHTTGLLQWPDEGVRAQAGASAWEGWSPLYGMKGLVVHCWEPSHPTRLHRSYRYEVICLVLTPDGHHVPVTYQGLELLRDDHDEGPSSASFWDKRQVRLLDVTQVQPRPNDGDQLTWPSAAMRQEACELAWGGWLPHYHARGRVVHCWQPGHSSALRRSAGLDTLCVVEFSTRSGTALALVCARGLERLDLGERGEEEAAAMPREHERWQGRKVRILDVAGIHPNLNYTSVQWPSMELKQLGGESAWGRWRPHYRQIGRIVHCWLPADQDAQRRSHCQHTVFLLEVNVAGSDTIYYVGVNQQAVELVPESAAPDAPTRIPEALAPGSEEVPEELPEAGVRDRGALSKAAEQVGRTPRSGIPGLGGEAAQALRGPLRPGRARPMRYGVASKQEELQGWFGSQVRLVDLTRVLGALNMTEEVKWPSQSVKIRGGEQGWDPWKPEAGLVGTVVQLWAPDHPEPRSRSHCEEIIVLVNVANHFVPIGIAGLSRAECAGNLKADDGSCYTGVLVVLNDCTNVYSTVNQTDYLKWPSEEVKTRSGKNAWGGRWRPTNGDEGMVVHAWVPGHHDPLRRSCFDDALLYVELLNGRAVVIAAQGVQALLAVQALLGAPARPALTAAQGVQALLGQPKLILEAPVVEEEAKAEGTIPEGEPGGTVMAHTESAGSPDVKIAPPATSHEAALQEQLEVLRKEKLCKVCMDNEIDSVLIPCGHVVCCFGYCASRQVSIR
ncbi:hypothetical protein CYMTET_33759 [Cymbomonas tetramitiformis]|uniref:Uncharacterized protein n=1 Tax=Cymbomonas tetramitiformis TaxID=36881 RepID=A0AAE0FCM6_9CHLO|nr:hypothetical protein CYMTET_33759 [Cymbomonas tetramitiformis]